MKTVAVDFDGVLNTYSSWHGPYELEELRPGAAEFLHDLKARGFYVVIHTTRNIAAVMDWLFKRGLLPGPVDDVVNLKPVAVAYIDDRGLTFRGDYAQTLAELDAFKAWWEDGG
jgi:hypothetical protein